MKENSPARLLSTLMKSLIGCSVRESFPLLSTVAKAWSTFAANESSVLSASGSLWRLVWIPGEYHNQLEAQCTCSQACTRRYVQPHMRICTEQACATKTCTV